MNGAAAAAAALLILASPTPAAASACPEDEIAFSTPDGDAVFSAEIADDEESRARGLMFRESMDADHGMLFVYPKADRVAFWMKNTPLPLDIIFLNRQGVVCSIAANTTPFSLDHIPSRCAAQTVFEVNAGQAAATGVAVGSVARHPAIAAPLRACE
ncbi:MAG: DUF192 domain-containing protein [Pseudomonadota bacterium]